MDWYFGNEQQIKLQKKVDELTSWCQETKGAVNAGRFLGTDSMEALSWPKIVEFVKEGGAFTFRMVPVDEIDGLRAKLAIDEIRFDYWSVFSGNRTNIRQSIQPILNEPLPGNVSLVSKEELGSPAVINEIQSCMARNGVAPFTGKLLSGQSLPSEMIALRDREKEIIATAFGYFPYNQFSKWSSTAWGGLVAVDEAFRGLKLGVYVNALMVSGCIDKIGADEVQEFAAATNIASRRMIERCGLKLDPTVVSGIATMGSERFTK